jgi:uncharacterized protein GlcG (DUF336 family)
MKEYNVLHHDDAWKIAEAAYNDIKSRGKTGVISIVSSHGRKILQFVMEGITPYNMNLSERKAEQATSVGRRTRFIRDKVNDPDHPYTPRFLNINEEDYIPWAGGVPILDKENHVLGGIGVCIQTEDEDEEVAVAAVESSGFKSERV